MQIIDVDPVNKQGIYQIQTLHTQITELDDHYK